MKDIIEETEQQKKDRIIVDLLARDFWKVYTKILQYIDNEEIDY